MDDAPPSEDFGRQPPQDAAAEQAVLGGMLLSKDAIADVLERLRPGDFYRPAHQNVYDAIIDLYGRGEPADAVTVAAELDRRSLLRRIGGAPYMHTLISTVPTAANAGYYAGIVAEKALLRRLVEAGTRVVQYGYAGADGADVSDVVDRAQAEIYDVTERRASEDFVVLEELLQPTMDEIDAIASSGGIARGVPTGFTELDEVTNGLHAGQMIIIAARPGVGKSTLGLDFMRSCSIKHQQPSVIFSLEMSKSEIVMRLLSAEARIKLADMRSGRMSDDDWTRLARRMSEISEAPLYIDDSPNLTMMEIRAKARRLSQKVGLRMIVVDYMQLMSSGKKYESRQQEVSDFSRSLKLMAKELDVPVVAISQLNRGPEQRTDKKPMVSDLRESGCLTANTRILRADNGGEVTFGELMAGGERPLVWSLDERMRMVARPMTNVFYSGHKEVFKVRLASGREVEATANHPFMTLDGWIALGELKVGDRVAAPRRVPEPVDTTRIPDEEIVLLARMIGDGYASIDEQNLVAVTDAAMRKFVPAEVFAAPNDQVALFLRHLWATDGSVRWDTKARQGRIYFASTSRRLVDDVAALLLRFGVNSRILRARKFNRLDCWQLWIDRAESQTGFLTRIGVHGSRGDIAREVPAQLEASVPEAGNGTVPREVWRRVQERMDKRRWNDRDFALATDTRSDGARMGTHAPGRARLAGIATVFDDQALHDLAANDVFWDEIVELTSIGEHDVYDGTVGETHNFVANLLSLHNSLEQDADMVVLLHRPDSIDRDDPRAGEADLILGKHRNGPTKTITVAHQLHLSRFANMAK